MRRVSAPSCPVSIFIAGDFDEARDLCRAFCDEEGLCVTVTPTTYVYTGGEEDGVIVGLINYPRDLKDLNRPKVVQPETMNRKQRRAQAAALRSRAPK